MNRLEQCYEFRLAREDDIDSIMSFYRREWGANHILATDRDYFCYQHCFGERVNFLLACHRDDRQIHAAEGFIQYSRKLCDIAAVMWKVGSACRTPMLGVEVVRRLKALTNCRVYLGPGANPKTAVPLHQRVLRHSVGCLEHYYLLSRQQEFSIARIVRRPPASPVEQSIYRLREIHDAGELADCFDFARWYSRKPFKDGWYVQHRYFDNPIYRYRVFAVVAGRRDATTLIVTREVVVDDAKVLRIVDVLGDVEALYLLGNALSFLIDDQGYEYLDLYCKGLQRERLLRAGFAHRDAADPNVIPNYFEPFLRENIDIWYSLSDDDAVLFKGDGDQDRPSGRLYSVASNESAPMAAASSSNGSPTQQAPGNVGASI